MEGSKVNTVAIKTITTKPVLDARTEPRITLAITLYLRRSSNSSWYRRQVVTENVSLHGAQIVSDVPIGIDAEVEVYGFEDRFSATAEVKHVERRRDGSWSIGLEFTKKNGQVSARGC